MKALAALAGNVREGSKVFANPSGTQAAVSLQTTSGGAALAVLTGRIDIAAGLAGLVGGANLLSRLMVNPNFVNFLAKSTKVPKGAIPAQVNALSQLAAKLEDEDLALAAALLEQGVNNPGQ